MKRIVLLVIGYVALSLGYVFLNETVSAWGNVFFKIFPIALLLAALSRSAVHTDDRASVILPIVSLFWSMMGDAAGEVPFLHGGKTLVFMMLFFALAHVFYIVSFFRFRDRRHIGIVPVLIFLYYVLMLLILTPHISPVEIRCGAIIYMTLLVVMGASASMQKRPGRVLFTAGAILFILSDSVIAFSRFLGPVPGQGILVMSTYYAAQLCLNINLLKDGNEE